MYIILIKELLLFIKLINKYLAIDLFVLNINDQTKLNQVIFENSNKNNSQY